jgi:hypothetical protein
MTKPTLSIVATSRNDNHGGNALWRTQHFVNGLVAQAEKFQFPIELVLVDWNPPEDRPNLYEALKWPEKSDYFSYRVVEVPKNVHDTFDHADKLPLFQYIAKNVGIRRAQGDFILSTNIDILFSDEITAFMKERLVSGTLYRVDRYDIEDKIQDEWSFDEILAYAKNHVIRVNSISGTVPYEEFKGNYHNQIQAFLRLFCFTLMLPYKILRRIVKIFKKNIPYRKDFLTTKKNLGFLWQEFIDKAYKPIKYFIYLMKIALGKGLHTNACGDFTLLSKEDWFKLHGYPEWPQYSWHIDSVLVYQCYHDGIRMNNLPTTHAIYHIEHGSGWTPENEKLLFKRLKEKGIPYMDDKGLVDEFENQKKKNKKGEYIVYGPDNWGLANLTLVERGNSSC